MVHCGVTSRTDDWEKQVVFFEEVGDKELNELCAVLKKCREGEGNIQIVREQAYYLMGKHPTNIRILHFCKHLN